MQLDQCDRVVITGMGVIASVGSHREAVWRAVREGRSGVQSLRGIPLIPDDLLIGAPVHLPQGPPGELKVIRLCELAAAEALQDAAMDRSRIDDDRFGCAISGHMGDADWVAERLGVTDLIPENKVAWTEQFLPNSACARIAVEHDLYGPRTSHSTACASGLIEILTAVRNIVDGQCDLALAGSGEAIHPLFAAGFHKMRVLAHHDVPQLACRPFDVNRTGFVMGEGAAMFVIERLTHALNRGAKIYAEILGGKMLADAHHITGLAEDDGALAHLIKATLKKCHLAPKDVNYINAHGTATQQNDLMETRGIRHALGAAANHVCVSSIKSMLGHLVNAAGSVEFAITALALRDGFVPATINLTDPDPGCDLDCIPMVGRARQFEHALKLSTAFGGHFAAVALRRWDGAASAVQHGIHRRAA